MNGIALLLSEWLARSFFGVLLVINCVIFWKVVQETLIPEMWKPVFRNTETVLIGLMDFIRYNSFVKPRAVLRCEAGFTIELKLIN